MARQVRKTKARQVAARKGWRTRRARARERARAAKKGWRTRRARAESERRFHDRAKVKAERGALKKKRRPSRVADIDRIRKLRNKWDKRYPDKVRVFYRDPDGNVTKRYTVESWNKFMSEESYEAARVAMLEKAEVIYRFEGEEIVPAFRGGEFVLGIQGDDGDMAMEIGLV